MPERHDDASELGEAEEVFDVVFAVDEWSVEVVHPCKDPIDFPAFSAAAQLPSLVGLLFAIAAEGCDHLDPAVFAHLRVQDG